MQLHDHSLPILYLKEQEGGAAPMRNPPNSVNEIDIKIVDVEDNEDVIMRYPWAE